jgi:hypothetical protein
MATLPPVPPVPPVVTETPDAAGVTFAAEHALIGNRSVTFRIKEVNPPAFLYCTPDDGLYLNIANLQPAQVLTFSAQFLLPDGRLQPMVWTVTPPSNGLQTASLFTLSEGYLFNLTCTPTPNTRRGTTWVYAALRRGSMASGNNLQTLLQDYVDAYSGPTWPGGPLRSSTEGTGLIVGSAPAAPPVGSPFIYVTPAYARTRLRSLAGLYNASAQVATRRPYIWIYDASGSIYQDELESTVAASTVNYPIWAYGLGWAQAAPAGATQTRGLPDLLLNPSTSIYFGAASMQTGDAVNNLNMVVEQWFSL